MGKKKKRRKEGVKLQGREGGKSVPNGCLWRTAFKSPTEEGPEHSTGHRINIIYLFLIRQQLLRELLGGQAHFILQGEKKGK